MTKPFSYIAEAPTFSTGEIMLAVLILVVVFLGFLFALVAGIKGFHRLGMGQHESMLAKIAPVIGLLDLLFFLATFREVLWFALAPAAAHVVAYFRGRDKRQDDSPLNQS